MDYKFKTEPYEHQLTALGASHKKENFALFMEMGTGKSKVLIDNIAMLYDRGKINAALIVAPKGVYHNWERQELPVHKNRIFFCFNFKFSVNVYKKLLTILILKLITKFHYEEKGFDKRLSFREELPI